LDYPTWRERPFAPRRAPGHSVCRAVKLFAVLALDAHADRLGAGDEVDEKGAESSTDHESGEEDFEVHGQRIAGRPQAKYPCCADRCVGVGPTAASVGKSEA
jgi:hypothetical protein